MKCKTNKLRIHQYIYIYVDISRRKQSCANFGGDGPTNSTTNVTIDMHDTLQIDVIHSDARNLNGLNISKIRVNNSQFKVTFINTTLLHSRIPNVVIALGDIVTKVNGIDLRSLTSIEGSAILCSY